MFILNVETLTSLRESLRVYLKIGSKERKHIAI